MNKKGLGTGTRISVALAVLTMLSLLSLLSQTNTSSGAAQAVSATQTGTWTMQPGNTANTTPWLFSLNQGGNTATVSAGGALKTDGSAVTQPVSGTIRVVKLTACGITVASQAFVAVPTTATVITGFSATTCMDAVALNNTNATQQSVSLSDNQGTPVNVLITFQLAPFSQIIEDLHGLAFTTGVKWTASSTGITGAALGYQ